MSATTAIEPVGVTQAKVIAHSTYPGASADLVTVQGRIRRFMLPELNTHRTLSKNSASSRAIPLTKQLQRILDDPAYPEVWAAEQKGMQGGDEILRVEDFYLEDNGDRQLGAKSVWMGAAGEAMSAARKLADLGVHKSLCNRLVEPFMWHTVVLTGTAWGNFFAQRCSPLAQPEIRVFAEDVRTAVQNSTARELGYDDWHLPYVEDEDFDALLYAGYPDTIKGAVKVSAARCARVSYLTQEGKRDIQADLDLYSGTPEKRGLVSADPPHWSPLEHVATPWASNHQEWDMGFSFVGFDGGTHSPATEHLPIVGNLLGWRSLRTTVESEQGAVTYR